MALGISKYEPAPPGARPGAKAAGVGAPSVFNPITPPSATGTGTDLATDFEIPTYDWASIVTGGGGSNAPRSYYDALGAARTLEAQTAADKAAFEQAKYATELDKYQTEQARKIAGAKAALEYYQNQLGTVKGGEIPTALATTLEGQKNLRTDFANTTYQNLLDRLATGYGQAQNLTNEGFANLAAYLQGAPQSAYATAERATAAPVANDLAQYMAARGVETGRAEPGLQAATAAAQGGAANYNNLLRVLEATSAQANQSRLNEQAMAQRLAQAQLTAQKAAQEGSLNQALMNQLNTIQDAYAASKLQLQRDSIARENALQDAIATLQTSGYTQFQPTEEPATGTTGTTGGGVEPGAGAKQQTAVQALAAKLPGIRNETLATKVASFVAKNPEATAAAIKKAFPKLSKNIG